MGIGYGTRRQLASEALRSPKLVERLSEKGRRSLRCSLTEHLKGTFRPILASPYASQIHIQSVARTPFRTVSEAEFSEVRGYKLTRHARDTPRRTSAAGSVAGLPAYSRAISCE
jgi:hypothetical protein